MYGGEGAEVPKRRVALRLAHISIAVKRYYRIPVICAVISLGCASSSGNGSWQLTITPAEGEAVFTPEQAAAPAFGLTASIELQLLFDRVSTLVTAS